MGKEGSSNYQEGRQESNRKVRVLKMFTIPATQDQVGNLIAKLQTHNSTVSNPSPNQYVISGHGIYATASFDGTILSVSVSKKPFFVSMDMIENGLKSNLS